MPSQERLMELFNYSPDTGVLSYATGIKKLGKPAGCVNKVSGYQMIHVDGLYYTAQRLIWVLVTGEDPGDMVIDHIDRDKTNNVWTNLRKVTHSQNNCNKAVRTSKQRYPHVRKQPGCSTYFFRYTQDGERITVCGFKTPEEAYESFLSHRTEYHA